MEPIATERTNFTFTGRGDVGDLPCERTDEGVFTTWELTEAERATIAEGGRIELGIMTRRRVPPVSLIIVEPVPA